jgi:ABC-type arginine/histidine transport system permease subunit
MINILQLYISLRKVIIRHYCKAIQTSYNYIIRQRGTPQYVLLYLNLYDRIPVKVD